MILEDLMEEVRASFTKASNAQVHALANFAKDLADERLSKTSMLTEDERSMSKIDAIKSIRMRLGVGLVVAKGLYEKWL